MGRERGILDRVAMEGFLEEMTLQFILEGAIRGGHMQVCGGQWLERRREWGGVSMDGGRGELIEGPVSSRREAVW